MTRGKLTIALAAVALIAAGPAPDPLQEAVEPWVNCMAAFAEASEAFGLTMQEMELPPDAPRDVAAAMGLMTDAVEDYMIAASLQAVAALNVYLTMIREEVVDKVEPDAARCTV